MVKDLETCGKLRLLRAKLDARKKKLLWEQHFQKEYRVFFLNSLFETSSHALDLPFTRDSSHHQDDITFFLVGNPNLNLYLPLASILGLWGR